MAGTDGAHKVHHDRSPDSVKLGKGAIHRRDRSSIGFHRWVVAYDITDDARRRAVAKILEGIGKRVQHSVFECTLYRNQIQSARFAVRAILESGDRVHWLPQCSRCRAAEPECIQTHEAEDDVPAAGNPFGSLIL